MTGTGSGRTPPTLPRGLVLFPPGTGRAKRRRRLAFVGVLAASAAALVWPVFPWVQARLPEVAGLPPALVWVIAVLLAVAAAVAALERADRREGL